MIGSYCRFSPVNSWEKFGTTHPPHDDQTHFHPWSPHGAAKVQSSWITPTHREAVFGRASAATAFELTRFSPVPADHRRQVPAMFGQFSRDHVHDQPPN
jgi:hypothetical protein